MPGQPPDTRVGVYECEVAGKGITKGKWVCGYYGLFSPDRLRNEIIPDLKQKKESGWPFSYPLLVVSYSLGRGDPPKPLPLPVSAKKLSVTAAGGLIRMRRMVGIPIRRKKVQTSECQEALVDAFGKVTVLRKAT